MQRETPLAQLRLSTTEEGAHAGRGLVTMRERAEALGAELSVSAASETGTTVRVIVDAQPSAATNRDR